MKDKPEWAVGKTFEEQKREIQQFYIEEAKKLQKGITIGGVKIHPWLYWHLNYWTFLKDSPPDENGTINSVHSHPDLRDNEWLLQQALFKSQEENKGIVGVGARRLAKSVFISSWLAYNATTKYGGELRVNSVIGGTQKDLDNIADYVDYGLDNIHPFFKMDKVGKDWDTGVTLGTKNSDSSKDIFSKMTITNVNMGTKKSTQKAAGATPNTLVFDEALSENELVVTNSGFVKLRDIKKGDKIFGADGKLTTILDKVDVGVKQLYDIKLRNGVTISACGDHLWGVLNKSGNYRVLSTIELIKKSSPTNKFKIPITKPVKFSKKEFNISPYMIGYLIGDGGLTRPTLNVSFTPCDENNIYENLKIDLHKFDINIDKVASHRWSLNNCKKLRDEIIKLNLNKPSWEKNIPDNYLFGDEEQRRELLAGLMDSDGCCSINKSGNNKLKSIISYTTTSEILKDSFIKLCLSLGILTSFHVRNRTRKGNQCRIAYDIILHTDEDVFRLRRKSDKIIKRITGNPINIVIDSITKADKEQAYCLKVDNEDKLFLTSWFTVTHNCGKYSFLKTFNTAKYSIATEYGWRTPPILFGTSGEMSEAGDLQKMVNNPSAYNMIEMNWDWLERRNKKPTWTKKVWGVFFPGQMSLDGGIAKKKTNLADYLEIDNPELKEISLNETQWEKSTDIMLQRRKDLERTDKKAYDDELMFMPLDPEDCFLDGGSNPFPMAEATRHRNKIFQQGDVGRNMDVFKKVDQNDTQIQFDFSSKPIANFPFEGGILDCGIQVFEDPPEENDFDYTYVAGLDHYKHIESTGDSIGALYIFKRFVNLNDAFSDRIVCSYVSRPASMNTFNRTCELLLEGYGAECLQENADISLQQYLESKGKDVKLLANGEEIARRLISGNAKQTNKYGLTPTTKNKEYLLKVIIAYCWEVVESYIDRDGNEISVLGIERINDIHLLDEIIGYKPGKNVDRIIAFAHALVWARYLDDIRVLPRVKQKKVNDKMKAEREEKKLKIQSAVRSNKYSKNIRPKSRR